MPGELHIRFKVTLATEHFTTNKDHTGGDRGYTMGIKLKIFDHEGAVEWMYVPDGGRYDDHMPERRGLCEYMASDKTKLVLTSLQGNAVAVLDDFDDMPQISTGTSGRAALARPGFVGPMRSSVLQERNVGTWTMLDNNFEDPDPRYVFSRWSWDTGGGIEFTLGVGAGGGLIKLIDPAGRHFEYNFAGGGAGLTLPFDKIAKLAKIAKYLMLAQKASISGSTFDMWNKAMILKNPWEHGANELKPIDFTGVCAWIDISLVTPVWGKGWAGMVVRMTPRGGFGALLLMRGDLKGLALGAGGFGGKMTGPN